MKHLRDILGYLLGLVLFVGLMPTLMWLASEKPDFWSELTAKDYVAWGVMLCGLLLSIWTIVYMKLRGKGYPMDAFGHEVAPRTQHLMTDGPYRLNRNPMLTGTLIYLIGFALWLCTWQAVIVWLLFFIIMFIQVLSEERLPSMRAIANFSVSSSIIWILPKAITLRKKVVNKNLSLRKSRRC